MNAHSSPLLLLFYGETARNKAALSMIEISFLYFENLSSRWGDMRWRKADFVSIYARKAKRIETKHKVTIIKARIVIRNARNDDERKDRVGG